MSGNSRPHSNVLSETRTQLQLLNHPQRPPNEVARSKRLENLCSSNATLAGGEGRQACGPRRASLEEARQREGGPGPPVLRSPLPAKFLPPGRPEDTRGARSVSSLSARAALHNGREVVFIAGRPPSQLRRNKLLRQLL
ncbi:hypothetical protein GN956_G19812 [Arapaima gigas]